MKKTILISIITIFVLFPIFTQVFLVKAALGATAIAYVTTFVNNYTDAAAKFYQNTCFKPNLTGINAFVCNLRYRLDHLPAGPKGDKGNPGAVGSTGPQGPAGTPSWDEQRIASLEKRVANLEQKLNNPVVINFDDWILGDRGDNLRYGNIVISTYPGSHLEVTNQTADGFGNAHSLENKLSAWGEQPWLYKEQASFSLQFDSPVHNFSFWITGTFHDTTVVAYDKNGNILETFIQTYPIDWNIPSPDGSPWDAYYDRVLRFIQLDASGISKITIQPSGYDGFSIDDLKYSL